MSYQITLTGEQCQYILNLLADRPFKEVLQLYGSIELQMQKSSQQTIVPQPELQPEA